MTQTSSTETSPRLQPVDVKEDEAMEVESGYGSASSSTSGLPDVSFTPAHLKHINEQLEAMKPMDILRFCRILFPNLYQTTAFGLTGLVTIDMLSKIQKESPGSAGVDLIFLDTLYHFQETYKLVETVKARYSNIKVHTYRPSGVETVAQFEETYGEKLYDLSPEMYDWIAKVEPQERAYAELNVAAVLTGRRRSQGGARKHIPVIEIDEERGVVKINPLVTWSFRDVQKYIKENGVPYNELLDRGYKSVGDWHSTSPVSDGEDERAGRWKGQAKTECGIHNKQSRYDQFLRQTEQQQPRRQNSEAEEAENLKELDFERVGLDIGAGEHNKTHETAQSQATASAVSLTAESASMEVLLPPTEATTVISAPELSAPEISTREEQVRDELAANQLPAAPHIETLTTQG